MAELLLRDHRTHREAMRPVPLKLPAATLARVDALADRLRCSRSALARTLLIERLEQLEQATTTGEVA